MGDEQNVSNVKQPFLEEKIVEGHSLIVRFDATYAKSCIGIIHLFVALLSLAGLVCLTTSNSYYGTYLHLPLAWHHRCYVSTCVISFLLSFTIYFLNVTTITQILQKKCYLLNAVIYGLVSFASFFSSSLVASAVTFYISFDQKKIPITTIHHLVAAAITGYICTILLACATFNDVVKWRQSTSNTST